MAFISKCKSNILDMANWSKHHLGQLIILAGVIILCLVVLMMRHSDIRPVKLIEPTYRTIYNILRGNMKLRLRLRRRSKVVLH